MMGFTPEFKSKVAELTKKSIDLQKEVEALTEEIEGMFLHKQGSFVVLDEDENFCWFIRIKSDAVDIEAVKASRMF